MHFESITLGYSGHTAQFKYQILLNYLNNLLIISLIKVGKCTTIKWSANWTVNLGRGQGANPSRAEIISRFLFHSAMTHHADQ